MIQFVVKIATEDGVDGVLSVHAVGECVPSGSVPSRDESEYANRFSLKLHAVMEQTLKEMNPGEKVKEIIPSTLVQRKWRDEE